MEEPYRRSKRRRTEAFYTGLDQLFQAFLWIIPLSVVRICRPGVGQVGDPEIQETEKRPTEGVFLVTAHSSQSARVTCSLVIQAVVG